MKKVIISFIYLLISSISIFSMENLKEIKYKQAEPNDVSKILELINTKGIDDAKKIVIVPEKFREQVLSKALEKKQIFLATEEHGNVVAFKKMFLLKASEERKDILKNEIRVKNVPVYSGKIVHDQYYEKKDIHSEINDDDLVIYNGGDFTHPDYRNKGINQKLTEFSFQKLKQKIQKQSNADLKRIVLVYGLVCANAGLPGSKEDRTRGIIKAFLPFVNGVLNKSDDLCEVEYYRYEAYMPTFASKSEKCEPLEDKFSVPGYGCLLIAKKSDTLKNE